MTAPLKPSEILERAGDLLAQPGAWTQQSLAAAKDGRALTHGFEVEAVCWCAYGAIEHEAGTYNTGRIDKYFADAIGTHEIALWNDRKSRRKGQVVAAFRKAAALAREAGE